MDVPHTMCGERLWLVRGCVKRGTWDEQECHPEESSASETIEGSAFPPREKERER